MPGFLGFYSVFSLWDSDSVRLVQHTSALQIEGQQPLQDPLVGQAVRPAVHIQDSVIVRPVHQVRSGLLTITSNSHRTDPHTSS